MRQATVLDAEAIAQLHVAAYEASLAEVVNRDALDRANASRLPMWTSLLADPPPGQAVFVVEREQMVGFVSAGPTRESGAAPESDGEVYALFVDPRSWGQGVGRALMTRSVQYLTSMHLRHAKLWVFDANYRARTFYESLGWNDTGVERVDDRGRFLRYAYNL
ncbi:MAG: hypothetical protein QOJ00_977 [Actinomycetota bacterium]